MINDLLIYKYLLGDFEIGKKYTSPLRSDDDTPSFSLYYDGDVLKWKDFGYDACGNKAINYLMEYMNLPFIEAIKFYNTVIKNTTLKINQVKVKDFKKVDKFSIYNRTFFKDFELDYWNRFGIDEKQLIDESIYPLESFYYGDRLIHNSCESDPAFILDLGSAAWKVYRPLNKTYKWTSKNLENVKCEGCNTLAADKKDKLIITSSTKDRLVIKNLGYESINPLSESNIYPLEKLELNYDKIYVLFDNDDTGRKYTDKLTSLTDWIPLYLDSKCKDIAEAYEHDLYNLKKFLHDYVGNSSNYS